MRRRSIRATILALEGILVAIVLLSAMDAVRARWDDYRGARTMIATNRVIDDLMQAAQSFAFERGRTNAVLHRPAAIPEDDRAFLEAHRKTADDALARAIRRTDVRDGDDLEGVLAAYRTILTLRPVLDKELALPLDRRDPSGAERAVEAWSLLLQRLAALGIATTGRVDRFTPVFRIWNRVRIHAFELRDALGLETSHYAAALASGQPQTLKSLARAMVLRGRAEALWADLVRDVPQLGNEPVRAALEAVRQALFVGFRPVEDQVVASALAGKPLTLDVRAFTAVSVPALDSIGLFQTTATEETTRYGETYAAEARTRMLMRALVALLALSVGVLVLHLVTVRLLAPLHRIREDLEVLSRGDTAIQTRSTGRDDEIGALATAVGHFRNSLIERQRLEAELKEQSIRDPLTGLLNRRYLEEAGEIEFSRASRAGTPIGVLMIDVDHFKMINDRFGHDAGDAALRVIAKALLQEVRAGDLVCRFGGEEFVAMLPGATMELTVERGLLLLEIIRTLPLLHGSRPLGRLTASIGAAVHPVHGSDLAAVITAADRALYEAKRAGRNRLGTARDPSLADRAQLLP
ncbi:MAG: diguanylate cyclase [Telmatospirillum sp.]|nr:diguanylate cyclase [Telmatospirillum sp.]